MEDWSIFEDASGPATATDDWGMFEDAIPSTPSAPAAPTATSATPEDFDYIGGDLSQTDAWPEMTPEMQASMKQLQDGWRQTAQPAPEDEQAATEWRQQKDLNEAIGELPPDATELERLTHKRRQELLTGQPADYNLPQLQESYTSETDPERKRQRLVDLQVAQRRHDIAKAQLAGTIADMQWSGQSPDQQILAEHMKVEEGLGPDMKLANAPIMRGATTGWANFASYMAEGALRSLPGEGAPSQFADKLGRQRVAEGQRQAYLDEQQGPVASAVNSAVQTIAEFAGVAAVGGAAGLGVKGSSLLASLFSSTVAANNAYTEKGATDSYALGSAVINGLLTYAGGRLGGGTWEELFGGQIGARTASKMLRSYTAELGDTFGQNYAQIAMNRGYGIGNQNYPTWKENLYTLAVATLAESAGEVMAGRAGDGSQSANAARFVNKKFPSRADAAAANVDGITASAKDRAVLAESARAAVAEVTASRQQGPSVLDELSSRHKEVADAMEGPTGTPEFKSIREHTQVVLDRYEKSGASTGIPELDSVMPTIIALHDIGKPAAIAKGDKNLQHAETLPILERVMRAEGATDQQVDFAKSLVGQDVVGQLIKGQIGVKDAYSQIETAAKSVGLTPQQFLPIAQSLYSADAGSYAGLSSLFDDQGRVTNYDLRALEELTHGEVQSIPWSESYRGGGQQPPAEGNVSRTVYSHSSAVDFTRFDASKDSGRNLAGPGAYLLPAGNDAVAKVYQDRAISNALKPLAPEARRKVQKAIKDKDVSSFDIWINAARQRQKTDTKRSSDWGQIADVLSSIRDNGVKGITLEFEFEPANLLDLGAMKSGGRILSAEELVAIEKVTGSKINGSKRGWHVYKALQAQYGYAGANEIVRKAGFDSIGFVHQGHATSGRMSHPVVVALDHTAPIRSQPASSAKTPPASNPAQDATAAPQQPAPVTQPTPNQTTQTQPTPNPPGPTLPPDPVQAAAGIPIGKSQASWLRRMFISGGNQNEGVRSMVFRRDSVLRKHAAQLAQNNRDLMREAKKAFGTVDDSVAQQLDEALKDPALAAQLPPEVGVIIQDMRLHIDELSDQIQALGDTSADLFLTIEKNKGAYVTRSYKKFSDPEGWAAVALKDPTIMGDFAAEVRQSSPNATDQDILTLAERLLRRQTMSNADLAATGSRTNAYVNVLKKRKDLSQAIRQLYGENKNAFTNYVETIERMSSLVAHKGFVENLKADGLANGYFSDSKTLTPGHVQEVAHGTHRQLEGLKGVFMEPELATAINDLYAMPAVNGAAQTFAGLSSLTKAMKTVYSFPKSWSRNFLGNPSIAAANGHWSFKTFGKSAKATWMDDLFNRGDAAAKARVRRLKELGVIEGVHMEALRDAAEHVTSAAQWFAGLSPDNAFKKFVGGAARGYQAQDTIWKIHGYYAELDVLTRAYPAKSTVELEEMAARRIRAITPTYSEASRAAKFWARYVPVGPFAMFPAEVIRTTGNRMRIIAEDAKSGNPVLRMQAAKRAAGQAAALGMASAIAAASRQLLGISDEQDEAVRDRLAEWAKNSPIAYIRNDANGMPKEFIDLGFSDPFSVFTRPAVALARGKSNEAIGEVTQPFLSDDILFGTLIGLRYNRDENNQPVWNDGLTEWEQNKQAMLWTLKRHEPGTLTASKRVASAAKGETTASGQELSLPAESVSAIAGVKMQVLDRQTSDYFRNKEFDSRIQDSNSAIRKAFLQRGTVGFDQLENIYRSADDTRRQTMQKWKKYMEGSVKLGETQPLAKVIQDVGQASDTIKLMWAGNYVPYTFPEKDLRAMLKLPDGQARYDLWRRLHDEAKTNAAPRPEDPTP